MPNVAYMLANGLLYGSLGIWVGCMVMVAAGARTVFRILPDRTQAGNVVGGWLDAYDRIGIVCALAAAGTALWRSRMVEVHLWSGPWRPVMAIAATRYALLALMILAHLYAAGSVHPAIRRLRGLPSGDPARAAFDGLHARSVGILMANLVAGLVVIFLS